jgi:hypothetical protein
LPPSFQWLVLSLHLWPPLRSIQVLISCMEYVYDVFESILGRISFCGCH